MASASDHRAHAALQPADCLILLPQRLPAAAETSIGPAHYPAECTQSDAFLQPSLRARNGRANSNSFKVVFGIITHKNTAAKSDNLPLFSKISLMRHMQRLDLMRVASALTFIEDQSPKKEGHPKHVQIIVEVCAGTNGKPEVRPVAGQGFDPAEPIRRCPKEISQSAVGNRFKLSVRRSDDGALASFHAWPFERIA